MLCPYIRLSVRVFPVKRGDDVFRDVASAIFAKFIRVSDIPAVVWPALEPTRPKLISAYSGLLRICA